MLVHHQRGAFELFQGDSAEILRHFPANSAGSLITDPPGGVGKDGNLWDTFSPEFLSEIEEKNYVNRSERQQRFSLAYYSGTYDLSRKGGALFRKQLQPIFAQSHRVLKPGAFALVWASTRSFHWTATALENAGFRIRDMVAQLSGNGVPMWGNLKPLMDPWILAQKAPEGSVKNNIRKWNTGALNIDPCRVGKRYPNNVILSHHEQCGQECMIGCPIDDLRRQGKAHYFYQSRNARPRNSHPTSRPTPLMRYFCRLITNPGEVVLDPFGGSGSTGVAALLEGMRFVGIERESSYIDIATKRLLRILLH